MASAALARLVTLAILILVWSVDSEAMAANTTARLAALRLLMRGPPLLHAYLVPTADAHQSEYIAASDARRAYISGFTGSAGNVLVTPEAALLWTDGRYYLQAQDQLGPDWQLMKESLPTTPSRTDWLLDNLPPESNVGADPTLLSESEWEPLQTALRKAGHKLLALENNLIDAVWRDDDVSPRPPRPADKIFTLPVKFSGKTIAEKLAEVRKQMSEKKANILILTDLAEVAYLFNLRGSDVQYNPVFFGYAVVTRQPDESYLITRSNLFDQNVTAHFAQENVSRELKIEPYETAFDVMRNIVDAMQDRNAKVWISRGSSHAVHSAATNGSTDINIVSDITPVALMKAIKNDVETQGMIDCHIRDGAALIKYFAWLEEELVTNGRKNITEISAADQLERFRRELPNFVGLSFSTISGSGPNGAIIHYKPNPDTDRLLSIDELYLCDSGAQFWDGTTDVTRTWHFGNPTPEQKEAFTLVLKGQIALGESIFPFKAKGNVLDTIARRHLWQQGMNYAHGTGHGIGYFMNVHEGPMGISWRQMPDDPGLQVNMFLSNEPGYYKDGEYGIRIEDIIRVIMLIPPGNVTKEQVRPRGLRDNFNGQGALGFETVTMAPLQRKLIEVGMLTEDEIQHVDKYHAEVYAKVAPVLDSQGWSSTKIWLAENTRPLR